MIIENNVMIENMNMANSKKPFKKSKKDAVSNRAVSTKTVNKKAVSKNNNKNSIKNSVKTARKNAARTPIASNASTAPNKVLKLILFLVLIFIMGIILTVLIYNKYNLLQYREFDLSVKIENGSSSFNTSTEGLNFARMYPGGEVTKRMDIHSLKRSLVHIEAVGDIASFISVSENNFVMEPDEYKQVEVYLTLPIDALEGPYTGTLQIYFYRK